MKIRVLLSLKLFFPIVLSLAEPCDRARTTRVQEGNLGQSPHYNWLGVLIVHLREWKKPRTAITGIVLVKDQYALANADDVARIPQKIFYKNSRAMFIPARGTQWFVRLSTFITHPDYQDSAFSSIAIIKLNLDNLKNNFPLTPICLPTTRKLKPSENLYLTGITDDNKKMEKIIYKIQYLDKKACEEYYSDNNRTGFPTHKVIPSSYLCGVAPSIGYQCDWENGMVLVSNSTGYFNLIGLAIHGPGCAAPARFVDLSPYIPWIHSVTGSAGGYSAGFRRRHGDVPLIPNVPIHELYSLRGGRRQNSGRNDAHEYEAYPFDEDKLKFHIIKPTGDNKSIVIFSPLGDTWERYANACTLDKKALYREYFELRALDGLGGTVKYRLSLWDLGAKKCACVRLTVDSKGSPDAVLSFKEKYFDYKENTRLLEESGETPEELFRYFPLLQRDLAAKTDDDWVKREEVLKPTFIKDERFYSDEPVLTYDLYIKLDFFKRAIMEFEMFAEGETLDFSKLSTTTSTTASTTTEYCSEVPGVVCNRRKMHGKKPRRQMVSAWGIDNWEDNMVKMMSLVVDEDEPQEAGSAGHRERATGGVVMTCLLATT